LCKQRNRVLLFSGALPRRKLSKREGRRKEGFISSHVTQLPLLNLFKGSHFSPHVFTVKIETAVFVETLKYLQSTM
jgi:hypothetical protein